MVVLEKIAAAGGPTISGENLSVVARHASADGRNDRNPPLGDFPNVRCSPGANGRSRP
jgi:hypothetical protein